MTLTVSNMAGKKIKLVVEASTTIAELRALCEEKEEGLSGHYFFFAGKELLDPLTVSDYNIQRDSTIHTTLMLRGISKDEVKKRIDAADDCGICLEKVIQEITMNSRLPCKHEFHTSCIRKWFQEGKSTCPLCVVSVKK